MGTERRNGNTNKFDSKVRALARMRANGICEVTDCDNPNNNVVDHRLGKWIATRLMRLDKAFIHSAKNAQLLCDPHARAKQMVEDAVYKSTKPDIDSDSRFSINAGPYGLLIVEFTQK